MEALEKNHLDYAGKILARSSRGIVISLGEDRVAKLSNINSYEQLESESKKMSFANRINDLVVKFIELKKDENNALLKSCAFGELCCEFVQVCQFRVLVRGFSSDLMTLGVV